MGAPPWSRLGLTDAQWDLLPLSFRLSCAFTLYAGWRYAEVDTAGVRHPAVAFSSPGIPAALSVAGKPTEIDCSTLTASLLSAAYPLAGWDEAHDYGDLQVFRDRLPSLPDAPLRAVERRGVGFFTHTFCTGRWHLVQGWRIFDASRHELEAAGHACLVFAEPAISGAQGALVVLESRPPGGVRIVRQSRDAFLARYTAPGASAPALLYLAALREGPSSG